MPANPGGSGRRRNRSGRSPRRVIVAAAVAALLASVGSSVSAQTVDEARAQREATRSEQARVAAELDVLRADADEIRSALAGLDEAIAYQEAKVEAARDALATAEATARAAQAEYDRTSARAEEIRRRVTDAVLDSYTGGTGRAAQDFLGSADVAEVSQRSSLLDVVRGRYTGDLEELRALKERQRRAGVAADAAVAEAAALATALDAAKAELDAQRATQEELAAALRVRIGDVQAEADRLEAAERELTSVINRHLAEQAAAQGRPLTTPTLTPSASSGFIVPTDGPITSPFGYRIHPILGYPRLHAGTDFGAEYGTPVWASKAGEVIFAGWNGGYGNCVIIAHAGGLSTLYGHMSELAVGEGSRVGQGETIGWVGSTGASTGAHLHFEVWVGGTPTDPMNFL